MLAGLLSAVVVLSLVGCGPKISNGTKGETTTQAVQEGEKVTTGKDEQIVLQIVDSSDSTKARREVFHEKFMKENPNVKIEYTVLSGDQYQTTINSAIKAGTAPDLFALPTGVKLSTAVNEKWFMPMDEYVTEEFMNGFSEGALNEGITKLDGKTYVLPEAANIVNTLMFYNKNVLKDAGIDMENLPKTFSEFIEVNKQITKAGKGKYYGMIEGGKQANRLEIAIRAISSLGGSKSNDIGIISLVDGQNVFNSQAMLDAFDFYDTLVKEKTFHPDSINLAAPEARALFAQNQAAFLIQGSWCISTWNKENPDLDFGVMPLPVPDSGAKGSLPYIGAQPWMGISATSKHPDIAAKYLMALYSEEYQAGLVEDGGFVSAIEGVNEKYMTDPVMMEYYKLNKEAGKLAPDPIVGNPNTSAVYAQVTDISPNLGQIVQGVLSGSVDYKTELETLSKNTQKEWERAINATKESGVEVSMDDFEFKNWDPMKDYTAKDYEQR